jgi:hypothetical protein
LGRYLIEERALPPFAGLSSPQPYYRIARCAAFSYVEGDIPIVVVPESDLEAVGDDGAAE